MIRGETLEVIEAAPTRVTPPCPHAAVCGGCSWQHVDPAAQIELRDGRAFTEVAAERASEGAVG